LRAIIVIVDALYRLGQ